MIEITRALTAATKFVRFAVTKIRLRGSTGEIAATDKRYEEIR